jgi:hypothetical protein
MSMRDFEYISVLRYENVNIHIIVGIARREAQRSEVQSMLHRCAYAVTKLETLVNKARD